MGFILGIYHHQQAITKASVQPMIDRLGAFEHRHLTIQAFPGCILASANELPSESDFAPADGSGMAVLAIGTMVYQNVAKASVATCLAGAWGQSGRQALPDLEGAFAGAIYDPQAHSLTLLNDKFGMRPLFVLETADCVAFCNEIEPLLHLPGYRFEQDVDVVAEYFCLGTTLDGHTFARGIRNLAPASCLHVQAGKSTANVYWTPDIVIDHRLSMVDHATRISATLRTIIGELCAQLTNLSCLVSAGADTRLILSCIPADRLPQMNFLTSSLAVLPIEEDRDVIGALALVKRLSLQHQILRIAFSEMEFGVAYFDRIKGMRSQKILGGWHGGEYLGGFCSLAAPIREPLDFASVDAKLRETFSWYFRRQLKRHPHASYLAAQAQVDIENQEFYFRILQMGRAFFSTTYYGSRGSWLQPYEIVNQGYSPFWDSRFLQALLAVPFEMVAGYGLYNAMFRECLPALIDLPSNSPLTNRPDSVIARMTVGQDPKVVLQPKYQSALDSYCADPKTWRRWMYRRRQVKPRLSDGNAMLTMQFTDFEAWWRRYVASKDKA